VTFLYCQSSERQH